MVWDIRTSCGHEARKIGPFAVPYLQGGPFLDLGCGTETVWPSAIGIDSGATFGPHTTGIRHDIADLSMFANESVAAVFSSHALEDFPRDRVPAVLREWLRVIKVGGHLVLYVPSANLYPKIGEHGANPAHKWDIYPGDIERILKNIALSFLGYGLVLVESEERSGTNEYSLFIVVRKEKPPGWETKVWERNPYGKKRCLVIRYGAIGDAIIASSIFPHIKSQGYHLTVNCKPETQRVLQFDPHVDEWLLQGTDFVPNHELSSYWEHIAPRYDRIINLCESIEACFLTIPGRITYHYSPGARKKILGRTNYLEYTHDIAEAPYDFAPRFFPSKEERDWAKSRRSTLDGPVVVWTIHGSSHHKIYPWTQVVLAWLIERTPAYVVLLGDDQAGKELQNAVIGKLKKDRPELDLDHIRGMAGKWTIRETLAFSQVADCAVGPETGNLNAVSFEQVPKVIYMSHSSPENLTKHWVNTTTLTPTLDRCPCYPCHKLWGVDTTGCLIDEATSAAMCAASVAPEHLFEAIVVALGAKKLGGA